MKIGNLVLWQLVTFYTISLTVDYGGAQDSLLDFVEDEVRSTFDLSQLPNGTTVINSVTEYITDDLGAYYSIPHSVINIIRPGPLPYDVFLPTVSDFLNGFLSGDEGQGESPIVRRQLNDLNVQGNFQSIATSYVVWLVPVLVITLLSLVLAICFPCAGLCFCCCRFCGKCGVTAYHYNAKHKTVKCMILSIIIVLSSVFLFVGVILGFLSNDKISSTLNSYTSSVDAAIQDGVTYIDNTLDEVAFIATDQLDNVLEYVTRDVEGIATVLGSSLETALEREAQPFLSNTNTLLNNIEGLQNGFQTVNSSLNSLANVASHLNSSLVELQEALNNLSSLCMGASACLNLLPPMQQIELDLDVNAINALDALTTLDSVDTDVVQVLVDNVTQLFGNITGLLEENLGGSELSINRSQFDVVSSVVQSIRGTVDEIIGDNGTLATVRSTLLSEGDYYINLFDTYRYGLVAALLVAIFFIWMVFLSGLFCGVFGYSRKALPYQRSHISHCGARLLLFGTALSFLFGGLPLIPSSFLYFASTGIQKICNDLAPSEYIAFQRIFDDRKIWNGRTLIGNVIHSQFGIDSNISLTTFFKECESNSPIYEALQVESFLNVDELLSNFTNITNQFDLGDIDIGSVVNVTSSDLISTTIRQNFDRLQDNITDSANLTAYKEYLNEEQLSVDVQDLFDNLTELATYFNTSMMDALASYTLGVRDNLVGTTINTTIEELTQIQNDLVSNLTELDSEIQEVGMQVQALFDSLDQFLNQTGPIINLEVVAYVDQILGYVTGYIDFALNTIKNEVGRCRLLSAAYTGLHITFCFETLNGVNGFWFSVGWCVVFLIPMLISGAIITNYIRRSPEDVHPITEHDDIGYTDTVISNTRIVSETSGYNNQDAVETTQLPNTPLNRW